METFYTDTPTPTRTVTMKAALAYAKRGVAVFPCNPAPDKSPRTPHGFKDATNDRSRITAWWNARPDSAIGIPTGKASGFFVLDEDRTGALDELPHALPETREAGTPRDGRHLLFRCPAGEKIGNRTGTLPKGIDVRGEGGYILAPPSPGYSWTNDAPIANAPEWLLETLRAPEKPATDDAKGERRPVSVEVAGDRIPDGERNATLARIAGRLHDGTRNAAQLVADLEAINAARCTPPMSEAEVGKIARSIHARTPCKTSAPEAPSDVLEALDGIETALLGTAGRWKGSRWKTPRSIVAVLIKNARRHGKLLGEDVAVQISVRRLALEAGAAKSTTEAGLDRLIEAGDIKRPGDSQSGGETGTFLLKAPRARSVQLSTDGAAPPTVPTLRAPLSAERLRWSKPIFETEGGVRFRAGTVHRLGKTAEHILDFLEAFPGGRASVPEIAAALGIKRSRDMRRRTLARLEDAGVIEISGDAVKLRLDWLTALDRRREEDGEIADRERDSRKYAEQSRMHKLRIAARKLWKVMDDPEEIARALNASPVEVRYVLGLPAAPVRAEDPPRKGPDGLIEDLQRLTPGETASTEEPGAAHSTSPAFEDTPEGSSTLENREAVIAEAIEEMFRDRPDYRRLRVGQITCRLIGKDYVPLHFCPTDAEVESVLGEIAA